MNHVFDMKINPYTGTAEILLNGQQLSSQSQLRVCAIDHIAKWYKNLPDLLYSESNDVYTLKIQCLEIEHVMITAAFSGRSECVKIVQSSISRKYDTKTRCQWLQEAANNMGISIPNIPGFSIIATTDAIEYKTSILNNLESFTRNVCTDNKEQVNVIIATKSTYSEGKNYITSENDIIFVVDETCAGMAVELSGALAIRTKEQNVLSLMQQWIDITILYPYMMFCYSRLSNSGRPMTFYAKARLQMLTQEEPVVSIKMPSKLECGHTSTIVLDEFPSTALSVQSSDPSVVTVQNGMLKALRTGSATLEILSESGKMVCTHTVSVYFVPRVTSISLSIANGSTVIEGAQFVVDAKYNPTNAANIANAKWSVSPANALKVIGAGRFEALKSGSCTISLQVDGVLQTINVIVMPLPKRINMVPEIRMKVNAAPTVFHATLDPVGSGCKSLNVRVIDTSIAQWNPSSKSIVPINEGDTTLEVTAIDAKGKAVLVQNCKISILPENDIITPPTYPTIVVVCCILSLITATTVMSPIIAGCGGVVSVIEIIQNIGPVIKKMGTKRNKIELAIGIAGLLGCILAIVFYSSLI